MRRARAGVAAGLVVLAVVGVTGCGESAPSIALATASPSLQPPVTPGVAVTPDAPDASPSAVAGVVVDSGLLALLPAELDGNPVTPVPEAAGEIAADPTIGRDARAVAVGMVVAIEEGEEDFAVASVVELLPGVVDATYLGDWRDSYDEAACEQAGGVDRRAEAEIGGRPTFIATCAGGVRTYHVHVPAPDRIVSITSVGEARLGEQLVAAISAGS